MSWRPRRKLKRFFILFSFYVSAVRSSKTSIETFDTASNGNKSRTFDYYAGVLLGGQTIATHESACAAYCGKEGFTYSALKEHTTTDFDCFCGNLAGTACSTSDCIYVSTVWIRGRVFKVWRLGAKDPEFNTPKSLEVCG